jgi:hypothetical protein
MAGRYISVASGGKAVKRAISGIFLFIEKLLYR